mmetsp:Transcript_13930/g.41492  ORF Transcript_13930/g.41492 Transcript_13930/m.41492 type:complete len:202 (-) Transcript_13930:42-647(-)
MRRAFARRFSAAPAVSRHRPVCKLGSDRPVVANDAFVAPNASVVGQVELRDEASVWYGAVIRGDLSAVSIGAGSNVQARAVVQTVESLDSGFPAAVKIGDGVSIGAGATLRSCVVEHNVSIGAGAAVLEGAVVQANSILEPGAVVPAGGLIPAGEKWAGNPAAFVAKASPEDVAANTALAEGIVIEAAAASNEYDPAPGAP